MTSSFKGSIHNILLRQKVPFSCSVKIIDCSKSDPLTLLRLKELAVIAKAHKHLVYSNFLTLPENQCDNKDTLYFVSINEVAELCGVAHCSKVGTDEIYINYLVTRSWIGATTEDQTKFKGTGTRLLDAVVLYARSHGYKYLKLYDATDATKRNFYNHYGFTTIAVPSNAANNNYGVKYYVVPSVNNNQVQFLYHRLNIIKDQKDIAALEKYLPKNFKIKDFEDFPIGPNPYEHTTKYTFDADHPFEPKWSYPAMKHVVFNDPSHPILYADTFPELESLTFYGNELKSREKTRGGNNIVFSKLKGLRIEGEFSEGLDGFDFPALQTLHIGEKAILNDPFENGISNIFKDVTKLSIVVGDPFYYSSNYKYFMFERYFPNVTHLSLLGEFNDNLPEDLKVKHLILGAKYNRPFAGGLLPTFVNAVAIELTGDYPVKTFYDSFDDLPVGSTVKLKGKLIYPPNMLKRKL